MLSIRPKLRSIILIAALSLPGFWTCPAISEEQASQEKFSFIILHSNDIHSHEDSFEENGKVVGGMPRLAHLIKNTKKNYERVIAVDAGDMFQGTGYFEQYKGASDIECMNKAGYDIVTIGNHDLDEGPANLGKQLHLGKFDVVSCNLDVKSEPSLRDLVKPSVIKEIGGQKVAFIGVITPALKELQPHMGDLQLISPGPNWMDPVKTEVEKMKKQGINKIVLISHCGLDLEKLLAEIPDVDVVVGGHSHTRLDEAVIVDHPDGSKAMVVQTGCYTRALGRMDLVFDKEGKLIIPESKYHLINITDRIFEDADLKAYVTEMAKPFQADMKTVLAFAEAKFDKWFRMSTSDSPIGDLVCDALFDAAIDYGATISLQNRGGLRSIIDQGQITPESVREVLPFQNKLLVATLSGKTLLDILEHSAAAITGGIASGAFLDVHGLKYAWDPTQEVGHRIVYALAQNKEGVYEPVTPNDLYRVAVNDFTFNGGEGYNFKEAKDITTTGLRLSTCLENYLKKKKQVRPSLPSRFLRVSNTIARKENGKNGEEIVVENAASNAEVTVIGGSDRGVSFLEKTGIVPLSHPVVVQKGKTDDSGRLELAVKDLNTNHGSKNKKKGTDGDDPFWVSVVLKTRDEKGTSTSVVSPPIQIR